MVIFVILDLTIEVKKILIINSVFYKQISEGLLQGCVKILKSNSLLSTNEVINTNNCYISVCKSKYNNKIIILSAIDNLIKGGAGQAVQNLNNKFIVRDINNDNCNCYL